MRRVPGSLSVYVTLSHCNHDISDTGRHGDSKYGPAAHVQERAARPYARLVHARSPARRCSDPVARSVEFGARRRSGARRSDESARAPRPIDRQEVAEQTLIRGGSETEREAAHPIAGRARLTGPPRKAQSWHMISTRRKRYSVPRPGMTGRGSGLPRMLASCWISRIVPSKSAPSTRGLLRSHS